MEKENVKIHKRTELQFIFLHEFHIYMYILEQIAKATTEREIQLFSFYSLENTTLCSNLHEISKKYHFLSTLNAQFSVSLIKLSQFGIIQNILIHE